MADHKQDYQSAVLGAALAGHMIRQHDLPGLLVAIERAEVLGPVLDPTLYRKNADAMREDEELLRAALPLWQLTRKRELLVGANSRTEGGSDA